MSYTSKFQVTEWDGIDSWLHSFIIGLRRCTYSHTRTTYNRKQLTSSRVYTVHGEISEDSKCRTISLLWLTQQHFLFYNVTLTISCSQWVFTLPPLCLFLHQRDVVHNMHTEQQIDLLSAHYKSKFEFYSIPYFKKKKCGASQKLCSYTIPVIYSSKL